MTYTVISFGKASAHVRNCLLKKAHVYNIVFKLLTETSQKTLHRHCRCITKRTDGVTHDFVGAIKTVAAFFVLWRSVRTGTAGIDNCYRGLMSKGVEQPLLRP
jgi:hypothetical protein